MINFRNGLSMEQKKLETALPALNKLKNAKKQVLKKIKIISLLRLFWMMMMLT